MLRRTRALKLTLIGPSLLVAGCGGGSPAPRAEPVPAQVAELGPQEERALAASLAANALGNATLHPLPALPVVVYSFSTSEPPAKPGATRRYPSSTYRRSHTFIAPYYWTTSRYHAPAVYRPGHVTFRGSRPTTTSRPSTSTTRVGGFGNTGRSVSS